MLRCLVPGVIFALFVWKTILISVFQVREESSERSCEGSLSFHERLVAVLSKPYSRREYNELWKRVSCRAGERQGTYLHSREVKFMIGKPGKSYLDHHPGS